MDEKYKTLPIIDLTPFLNGTATVAVANQVVEACKEIGFLIIKGHQIKQTTIDNAFNISKTFFDLPSISKSKAIPCEWKLF